MAANIWKLSDMFGRTYYYEDEKKFKKRYMKVKIERHFRDVWDKRQGNPTPSWLREVEGYRIVNDDWVLQEVDEAEYKKAVDKREVRELQLAIKMRQRRA